jgi:hypothetical protein
LSNYVQSTNFATKDALPSGDPLKIVKGTEINTEFVNIAVAVATKADTNGYTNNGVVYASGSGILTNGSNLAFDGTNLAVNGSGSFSSSLVSSSSTLTDKPTFEFRKTVTGTISGTSTNKIGRISFYSQSGSSGTTTTESAYLAAEEYRVGNIGQSALKLATYVSSVGVETNYVNLSTNGLFLYATGDDGIDFTGDKYTFGAASGDFSVNCPAVFADGLNVSAGGLTVASVPVVTTTGSQNLTNKTATTPANGDNSTKLATTAYVQNMGLGLSQTWTDVTASRAFGTTYTNSTGKPIQIVVSGSTGGGSSGGAIAITVGGITINGNWAHTGSVPAASATVIVPPSVTYSASVSGSVNLTGWAELR